MENMTAGTTNETAGAAMMNETAGGMMNETAGGMMNMTGSR